MADAAKQKNKVVLGTSPSDALGADDRVAYVRQSLITLEYLSEDDAKDEGKLSDALDRFCLEFKVTRPSDRGMGGLDSRDYYTAQLLEKFRKTEFRPLWNAFEKALMNHMTPQGRIDYVKRSLTTLQYLDGGQVDDVDAVAAALDDFCYEWNLQRPRGVPNPNEGRAGMGGLDTRDDCLAALQETFAKRAFAPLWTAMENALANKKVAPPWVAQFHSKPGPPADLPSDLDVPPVIGAAYTLGKDGAEYHFGAVNTEEKRKALLKVRCDVLHDPTNYQQRKDYVKTLSPRVGGFKFKSSGLNVIDMPSWVKLVDPPFAPQPDIWNGVELTEHHDDHGWGFFADINGSTTQYMNACGGIATKGKRPTDYTVLNVFGPTVPFTVDRAAVLQGDFGGYVSIRLDGTGATGWIFEFGHLSEISKEIFEGRGHKSVFPAGTYLGSCRTWMGITTNPHCHISVKSRGGFIFQPYWGPLLTNVHLEWLRLDPTPKTAAEAVARWNEVVQAYKDNEEENTKQVMQNLQDHQNNRFDKGAGDYDQPPSDAA